MLHILLVAVELVPVLLFTPYYTLCSSLGSNPANSCNHLPTSSGSTLRTPLLPFVDRHVPFVIIDWTSDIYVPVLLRPVGFDLLI